METKTLLWASLGLVSASAVLYFLSRETKTAGSKFDPKFHTLEKLLEIL